MNENNYIIDLNLKKYIESDILPIYEKNEKAHGLKHIKYVIRRSFEIVKQNELKIDSNMVYTIAAYHDIGHHIDSKNHEKVSAEWLLKDEKLKEFFSNEQIETMKEAVEDHRASLGYEPRNIYGKIVSSADRNTTVEQCFERTYFYGKRKDPSATDEELYERAYDVLCKKFGENGYAKFFFKDQEYSKFLIQIREILKDKKYFCQKQKEYIENLIK